MVEILYWQKPSEEAKVRPSLIQLRDKSSERPTETRSTSPDFEKTSWSRDLQVFSKLVESAFSVSRNRFCSVPGENSTYGRRFIPGKDTKWMPMANEAKWFRKVGFVVNGKLQRSKGVVQAPGPLMTSPCGSVKRFKKTLNHHVDFCRRTRD